VRVDSSLRSGGIGRKLVEWAIARAREKGCRLVQLTSDKRRRDAIRFYESLGFVASHEGMKLELAP
jgi:GNAT superfamily N-acetyltransferase